MIVAVPGSKSVTARALFLAAAAEGRPYCCAPCCSDDTDGFAEGLTSSATRSRATPATRWRIDGPPAGPAAGRGRRLLPRRRHRRPLPARAGRRRATAPTASTPPPRCAAARSPRSPSALRALGVDLRHEEARGPPPAHRHRARASRAATIDLDASLSSQFLTALLLTRPADRRGPADHGHRHRLRPLRRDHPGDDARFGVEVRPRRRHLHRAARRLPRHRTTPSSPTPPPPATSSPPPR